MWPRWPTTPARRAPSSRRQPTSRPTRRPSNRLPPISRRLRPLRRRRPPRLPPVDPMTAQLENLASLHTQGILSDEEYTAAKAKALGI